MNRVGDAFTWGGIKYPKWMGSIGDDVAGGGDGHGVGGSSAAAAMAAMVGSSDKAKAVGDTLTYRPWPKRLRHAKRVAHLAVGVEYTLALVAFDTADPENYIRTDDVCSVPPANVSIVKAAPPAKLRWLAEACAMQQVSTEH